MNKKVLLIFIIAVGLFADNTYPAPQLSMDKELREAAHFKEEQQKWCILTVKKKGKGFVSPYRDIDIPCGKSIKLEAYAAEGWVFEKWEGDITKTSPRITIVVNRDMNVTAVFLKKAAETPKPDKTPELDKTPEPEKTPKLDKTLKPEKTPQTDKAPVKRIVEKGSGTFVMAKIKRGSVKAERLLSNYLYYFKGKQLRRIDTNEDKPSEYTIESNDQRLNPDNYYNTCIYPNENKTGNRFIVFFDNGWEENPSFIVYDKLEDTFDNDSFKMVDPQFRVFTRIYPVDYSAGGDYIHASFIAVYMYIEKGKRRQAIVQYEKSKDNQVVREELAKNVISHYYNPYEKKLAWLKQSSNNKIAIQFYYVRRGKITKSGIVSCRQGYKPKLMFMAYGYLVINYSKSGSLINSIYLEDMDQPLEEYHSSRLFSHSLGHNKGEFHLLISGGTLLHHKEFNQDAVNARLRDGRLPVEILTQVKNDRQNKIKSILFLVRRNTSYICIVKRTGEKDGTEGYDLDVYTLNENFSRITGPCKRDPLPDWLRRTSKDLAFSAEGNIINIQSLTSGCSKGIAYINKWGELKFKPPQ